MIVKTQPGTPPYKSHSLVQMSNTLVPVKYTYKSYTNHIQITHTITHTHSQGKVTTTIILGQVVMMHINQGVAGKSPSGKLTVDFEKLRPVARLGGNTYGEVGRVYDLPRPDRST